MEKILLVEDDMFMVDIYATQLKKEGYIVDIAKDCEMALEKIKNNEPDLIVLDIDFGLGKMTGLELLQIIRNDPKTKNLKVVIVSNLNQKDYYEGVCNLGVAKCLLKIENTTEDIMKIIKETLK